MKRILALCILLCMGFNFLPAYATQENLDAITAPTYLLIDGATDAVLLEENSTTNIGINNFAKIMTAVLAIEKLDLTQPMAFTAETNCFYNSFGNIANSKPDTVFTVQQHLYNMTLLYSDASALALAVAHSGTVEAFVAEMNSKAQALGMKNTVFTSPDGRSDLSAGTTVSDLYILLKYAMTLPAYRDTTATVQFTLPNGKGGETQHSSRNHLLSKYTYSAFTYSPVTSAFVSYSEKGASLIAASQKGDKTIFGFVVNTPDDSTQVYKDMINLLEHGYNSYHSVVLAKKGAFLHQVPVKHAKVSEAVLVLEKDVCALLPYDYDAEKITYLINAPKSLNAKIEANTVCGTVTYYYDNRVLCTCNLVSEKTIAFTPFSLLFRLFSKLNTWLILIVILLLTFFMHHRQKKQKKKEELRRRKREILNNTHETTAD